MTTSGKKTIGETLAEGVEKLSSNQSISSPRLDCEILLGEILGLNRMELFLRNNQVLSEAEYAQFVTWINQRILNVPVSYLTNKKEFMSLDFYVEPGILIPRPETEFLVEYIVDYFKQSKSASILDLCTGSGAIAISIAHYLKQAKLCAVDKFDVCVKTTKKNAVLNGVNDRIDVLQADILEDFSLSETFDCLVSNPPYIEKSTLATLPSDVKDYEPIYALDGGEDGLIFYRRIIDLAENMIKPKGILVFEIGYNQGESVSALLRENKKFEDICITKDYAGLDRMITARKRG